MSGKDPLRIEREDEGTFLRVVLDRPKANVIDAAMTEALTALFREVAGDAAVKAVCFEGAGAHFSFGASVQEHQPEQVAGMLARFHGLFRAMADARVVLLAAVRGQCLGGGLELAAFAHRLFAAPDAQLGQPEIRLGVFAPVASLVLRERMGARAEDLLLTGRSVDADEAHRLGLVDEVADDPSDAALDWARTHLGPLSASSLRYAVAAARAAWLPRFTADLDTVERLYLDELMATGDAREGIAAFLERRPPTWRNR